MKRGKLERPTPRVNKTADYTITSYDLDGSIWFTNTGASGQVILFLPAGSDGYIFQGLVTAAQYIQFKANGSEKIRYLNIQSAAGGYYRSNVIGNFIVGQWTGTEWLIVGMGGLWSYDQ